MQRSLSCSVYELQCKGVPSELCAAVCQLYNVTSVLPESVLDILLCSGIVRTSTL